MGVLGTGGMSAGAVVPATEDETHEPSRAEPKGGKPSRGKPSRGKPTHPPLHRLISAERDRHRCVGEVL